MAIVNQINKRVQLNSWEIIKFQILTHCYLNKIQVSESDLECLTLLASTGEQELTSFCSEVFGRGIFKSSQTVRNAISKAEKKKLIVKQGRTKKKIIISPLLKLETKGNILLDFKFLAIET